MTCLLSEIMIRAFMNVSKTIKLANLLLYCLKRALLRLHAQMCGENVLTVQNRLLCVRFVVDCNFIVRAFLHFTSMNYVSPLVTQHM